MALGQKKTRDHRVYRVLDGFIGFYRVLDGFDG